MKSPGTVFTSMPLVRAVMTPFPYTIDQEASLEDAQTMMHEHRVRHLPVTHGSKLVGLLTARDLARAIERVRADSAGSSGRVADVAVFNPYVVSMTTPLNEVLGEMADRRIGSALVVKDERLAGIFTATDACRVLADQLQALFPKGGGDAA